LSGHDTVHANLLLNHPVDARSFTMAAEILMDLNVTSVRLLTNNPDKIKALTDANITVHRHISMVPSHWTTKEPTQRIEMDDYLLTKILRMNHLLDIPRHLLDKSIQQ
jgi:GTP cyclohydrolase II